MKKCILIGVFVSLFFLMSGIPELSKGDSFISNTSNTVEVTLLGPKQYSRTAGKPNIYKDSFPGRFGEGKLIIKNGDESGSNRISSAIIGINGNQIFGPSDFNQNVYEKELPIGIKENNTISVELSSKPGSYLTIEIKETVEGVAAGVVGSQGGIIEVTDSNSPLFGLEINIPSGALDRTVIISISVATNMPDPPSYVISTSTSFSLLPDGISFNEDLPVEVIVPYNFANYDPEDFVFVMQFDYNLKNWLDVGRSWVDQARNKMAIHITHFSSYQAMSARPNFEETVDIGFDFDRDRFRTGNFSTINPCGWGGVCRGISAYTQWYFNERNFNSSIWGLKCAYSSETARDISSHAQNTLCANAKYLWSGGDDDYYVACQLWLKMKEERLPQLLNMRSPTHNVLVYKYVYDSTWKKGYFYVFDSNWNTYSDKRITFIRGVPGDLLDYNPDPIGETYTKYQFVQRDESTSAWLQDIFYQHPLDGDRNECDPVYTIVFYSNLRGSNDIWGSSPDGKHRVNLSLVSHDPNNIYNEYSPKWSPDGKRIAFVSNKSGCSNIWIMDADGNNDFNLTNINRQEVDPRWSPDGTKIYFTRNQFYCDISGSCTPCPYYEIYVRDLHTGIETRLTNNAFREMTPVVSPDGSSIAYVKAEYAGDCCNPVNIWIMNADGGNQHYVFGSPSCYEWVSDWGINNKILFSKQFSYGSQPEVCYINPDGSGFVRLTNNNYYEHPACFSPDGTKILFTSTRSGHYDLWIMDLSGNILGQLTDDNAEDWGGDWRR